MSAVKPHTPTGLRREAEALGAPFPALLAEARQLAATVILGEHGRRRGVMGDEFWQYRPAEANDEHRRIDWRRSARSDAHFVRQTEWQAAQSVMLWIDGGQSMDFTGAAARSSKAVRARLLALAVAILLIRGGERVGLADIEGRPRTGEAQLIRLAEALTRGMPGAAGTPSAPDHAIPVATSMPAGSRAVFLSDFLGDIAPLEKALAGASDRGISGALVQILDPVEEAFPFDGRTIFESMSGLRRHETQKAAGLRDRYLERLAERKDRLETLSRAVGWSYHCHHTGQAAQSALLWLYGALERIR